MRFDWTQFLNLAFELFGVPKKRSNKEAKLRSAISRAYYAAFIRARNHLVYIDSHLIPAGVNSHEYVRVQFARSSNKEPRKIGRMLADLRSYRNMADYEDDFPDELYKTATQSLNLAEQIIKGLSRL